jgi:acetyltransferase-like isoleucine patch superfamily enzyme
VWFDPLGTYAWDTIHIGNDCFLGLRPVLLAEHTTITIGDKVMFGPRVMILAGNHNISTPGIPMFDVREKSPEDDRPVHIDSDVWIGGGAIIGNGVTVGTGAVVGAGAVVTREVPPYSVVGGVPARHLRDRFGSPLIT